MFQFLQNGACLRVEGGRLGTSTNVREVVYIVYVMCGNVRPLSFLCLGVWFSVELPVLHKCE